MQTCAMRRSVIRIFLAAGLVSVAAFPAESQVFEAVGTRALGMGGAFVASADDASAVYWNPAGLASGSLFSLLAERQEGRAWADRDRPSAPVLDTTGTIVAIGTSSLGLAYYRLRAGAVVRLPSGADTDATREDGEGPVSLVSLVTHHVAIAVVQPLFSGVTIGSALKYVRGSPVERSVEPGPPVAVLLDQVARLEGEGDGEFDLDLGLMVGVPSFRVGVVGHNLRTPTFRSSGQPVELSRHARAGLAVKPLDRLTLAADVDLTTLRTPIGDRRMVALGAEYGVGRLGLRGGGRFNMEDDLEATGTLGLSLAIQSTFWVDVQFTRGGSGGGDRGWGLAGRISL